MNPKMAERLAANAAKYGDPLGIVARPRPGDQPHHKEEPEKKEPVEEPEETPDEKEPESEPAGSVSMSAHQFQTFIDQFQAGLLNVIGEARKPVIDAQKLEQQLRMREHNRLLAKDAREMLITRFRSCNHMQLPGSVMSGCSCIAWATQDDKVRRGVCQHCGTVFSPKREECIADEIWQAYGLLARIPTHPAGNINSVFQSA
jgi:hypothetical protein